MYSSFAGLQEVFNKAGDRFNDKLNEDLETCFQSNTDDVNSFSTCMIEKMQKFEEISKRMEMYNIFAQKYVAHANSMQQDNKTTSQRLHSLLESALERLA